MAYVHPNFKTKKALKDAIKVGRSIEVYEPALGTVPENGRVHLEGPHYPAAHTWYAQGQMVNGKLTKVK